MMIFARAPVLPDTTLRLKLSRALAVPTTVTLATALEFASLVMPRMITELSTLQVKDVLHKTASSIKTPQFVLLVLQSATSAPL